MNQQANLSFIFCLFISFCLWICPARADRVDVDYANDIAPIFTKYCYPCHGPDKNTRQANLRLDDLRPFIRDVPKAIIRPGSAEESHLWHRIIANDENRMPPLEHGDALTATEKLLIKNWILTGAKVTRHWAYIPPVRPTIEMVKQKKWIRNPIDYFVLKKLNEHDLSPSPKADRSILLRRLALDTTGLPPTLEEMEAYESSVRDWEGWVDYFLQKNSYGEHQAVSWLDAARYADTSGHAADKPRTMWLFRNWVINAFNSNMPYDQFTIEQLAGDMLDAPTESQLIATGFHRNSMQALGNNPRKEEFRVKGIVDRLETTGKVWLGLTVGCAECHDHKYDPISQKEYYELFAIFNNVPHLGERFEVHGPRINVLSPTVKRLINYNKSELARLQKTPSEIDQFRTEDPAEILSRLHRWSNNPRAIRVFQNPALAIDELSLTGSKAHLIRKEETPEISASFSIGMWIKTKQSEADLVSKYDWKSERRSYVFGIGGQKDPESRPGNLYVWLSQNQHPFRGAVLYGSIPVNDDQWHHVAVSYDAGKSLRLYVDGVLDEKAELTGELVNSIAASPLPLSIGGGYDNSSIPNQFFLEGQIKDLAIFGRPLTGMQLSGFTRTKHREIHDAFASGLLSDDLLAYYRHLTASFLDERTRRIQRHEQALRKLSTQFVEVQVMDELADPRATYVHVRGNFENRGERVYPGVPAILSQEHEKPTNRLTFARGLFNRQNPLVARVAVNRIWQQYFGYGIVATPADFGLQGEHPSHPELLDWLAVEFFQSGWDMKHIHRLILNSAVYQQTSSINKVSEEVDPENRLLSRASRFRLSGEQIRDIAVHASGWFDDQIGGPSVFPVQPEGVGQYRDVTAGTWDTSSEQEQYRRSLYTYWQRMSPYPMSVLLDAPSRERCVVRRSRTNTPLQALALMNDFNMQRYAEDIAERVRKSSSVIEERVDLAFRLILSRQPDSQELKAFTTYVNANKADSLFLVVQVLLNLDESLTRE
ncbi:MAG: hypothetical protein CMJ76_03365 [Planctomycetaceae bacterium]|nr:hypothetical protein [Planctomycetaceae bacterium]